MFITKIICTQSQMLTYTWWGEKFTNFDQVTQWEISFYWFAMQWQLKGAFSYLDWVTIFKAVEQWKTLIFKLMLNKPFTYMTSNLYNFLGVNSFWEKKSFTKILGTYLPNKPHVGSKFFRRTVTGYCILHSFYVIKTSITFWFLWLSNKFNTYFCYCQVC